MVNSKRAEQFLPFDALKGLKEAIKEKEIIYVEKFIPMEESIAKINYYLNNLKVGMMVKVIYYKNKQYILLTGLVSKINKEDKYLMIVKTKIPFNDIYSLETNEINDYEIDT